MLASLKALGKVAVYPRLSVKEKGAVTRPAPIEDLKDEVHLSPRRDVDDRKGKLSNVKSAKVNPKVYPDIDSVHNSYKFEVDSLISRIRMLNMNIDQLEFRLSMTNDPDERRRIQMELDRLRFEKDSLRMRARMEVDRWVNDIRDYIRDVESDIAQKKLELSSTTDPKKRKELKRAIRDLELKRDHAAILLDEARRYSYSIPW